MKTDNAGRIILNTEDCIELLYNDHFQHNIGVESSIDVGLYNKYTYIMNVDYPVLTQITEISNIDEFDKLNQENWFMPDEYKDLDIVDYLMEKAKKQTHTIHALRTEAELGVYKQRGLLNLLRFLVYLVDIMKEHNIVWGVGRGSSVASYVLFLIGVHQVNSVEYELDFHEFLIGD
jgi:DNA polymerase III alpha subunit|tara:strand:- start:1166 stop:1693 length:528 start_codon:yes stop_codon:yes gene_type:complete